MASILEYTKLDKNKKEGLSITNYLTPMQTPSGEQEGFSVPSNIPRKPESQPAGKPIWETSSAGWVVPWSGEGTPGEKFLGSIGGRVWKASSPILGPASDLLSRGEYASAGATKALLEGDYTSIPGRLFQGILGREKTTFQDIAHTTLPKWQKGIAEKQGGYRDIGWGPAQDISKWPGWIKSAIGFVGSVAFDPANYVPWGTVVQKAVKVSGIDDAYRAIKTSKVGQYLAKHFSTKANLPEDMWDLYQGMRNEANYLVNKAIENNVPLEQAVRDIEKNLGIPRDVISELIEKPVVVNTEEIVQKALPLTAEVPLEASKTVSYIVKEDETLSEIAKRYGMRTKDLAQLNDIKNPSLIQAGQQIKVPAISKITEEVPQPTIYKTVPQPSLPLTREVNVGKPQKLSTGEVQLPLGLTKEAPVKAGREIVSYTVQRGDDLTKIAKKYGVSVNDIAKANKIEDVNKIVAGQEIKIPVKPKAEIAIEQPPKLVQKTVQDRGLPLTAEVPVGQDVPLGTTTKTISRLSEFPEEAQVKLRPVLEQFKNWADETIATEKAAGIAIEPLQSDVLQYLSHYMTPEAKDAVRKSGSNWQHLLNVKVQHGSTIPRQIKDLSIQEINELGQAGKIIPGYAGKVFMDDPVVLKTIRDIMSAKAIASANFLDEVIKNPQWALKEGAPEGWKALGNAAVKRFGPKVEGYKFAPEVADALTKVIQKTFEPEKLDPFWKAYDAFMSYWRRWTLGTSPQWMVNNSIGNLWNNYLADIDPKNYATAGEIMLGKSGKIAGKSYADVLELAKKNGVWNASLYGNELQQELMKAATGKGGQSITDLATSPIFKGNTLIENHARLSLFVDGLEKGMNPIEAAKRVFKFLFDYGDLTQFEKDVPRRLIMFYSWWRKNLPLQIEMFATKTQKFAILPKMQRALEANQPALQEKKTLPEWLQAEGPVQIGATPEGYTRFLTLGRLPAFDIVQMAAEPKQFAAMNPIAQAIASGVFGVNLYQDRYIEPTQMANVMGVMPTSERLSQALQALFPPLSTAQRTFFPYESKYGTTPTPAERLLNLIGVKTYKRYQPADFASSYRNIETQIADLKGQYRRAVEQGDKKLAETLLKKMMVLQEQMRQMAQ